MDKILDRKSFEVEGHWPLWPDKKKTTTQNRQNSNAKKTLKTKPNYEYPNVIVKPY